MCSSDLGCIAEYLSPESLARCLESCLVADSDRELLRRSVAEKFAAEAVASRYVALFDGEN